MSVITIALLAACSAVGAATTTPPISKQPNGTILFTSTSLNNTATTTATSISYTQWGQNISIANTSATSLTLVPSDSSFWGGVDNIDCLFQTTNANTASSSLNIVTLNSSWTTTTPAVKVDWVCCASSTSDQCGGLDQLKNVTSNGASYSNVTFAGWSNSTTSSGNATASTLLTTTTMPALGTGTSVAQSTVTSTSDVFASTSASGSATKTPPAPSATQSQTHHNGASGVAVGSVAACGLGLVGAVFALFL